VDYLETNERCVRIHYRQHWKIVRYMFSTSPYM
jgi:hypothetical protein